MKNISSWQDAVIVAGSSVLNQLLSFLPSLIGSILIFLLGWFIAGWTKLLIIRILKTAKLGSIVKETTIEKFFQKAEWKGKFEDIIGNTIKWIIVFTFFIAAVNVLGLSTVTLVLNGILAYIPNVISAALILLVGALVAGVVEGVVKGATGAIGVSTSRLLGKVSSWVVMIFTILAAISELGIAPRFINTIIIGAVATLSLGLGLALGLGSKDVVNQMLSQWYQNIRRDLRK